MLRHASEVILKDGQKILLQRLDDSHDRGAFACARHKVLVRFLQKHAPYNSEIGLTKTYVATRSGSNVVVGYISICSGSISPKDIPDQGEPLPGYPAPTAHIARMAVDDSMQGKGLGGYLLFHAIGIIVENAENVGCYLIDVYAKDDLAHAFYSRMGFEELKDSRLHLYMPIRHAKKVIETPDSSNE